MRPVAALFCPGRGSYGRDELGAIAREEPSAELRAALDAADEARRSAGRPTVRELDAAPRFKPGLHLDGENAAELIYFATLCHVERLRGDFDVAAVAGNSLGWYTALAAAGCVTALEGWRLVVTMARLQKSARGGQLLTTTLRPDWTTDPALVEAIDVALAGLGSGMFAARSIRLGGHEVLAGDDAAIAHLLRALPKIETDSRAFPFQLAGHGPFHTELCTDVAAAAQRELAHLAVRAPRTHLIDGRGDVHTPWSADPAGLQHYTTGPQVTTTFDFSAAVRCAIREFCPDVLLCAGPGTSLRAPVGHVVLRERYRGIATRAELLAAELIR